MMKQVPRTRRPLRRARALTWKRCLRGQVLLKKGPSVDPDQVIGEGERFYEVFPTESGDRDLDDSGQTAVDTEISASTTEELTASTEETVARRFRQGADRGHSGGVRGMNPLPLLLRGRIWAPLWKKPCPTFSMFLSTWTI